MTGICASLEEAVLWHVQGQFGPNCTTFLLAGEHPFAPCMTIGSACRLQCMLCHPCGLLFFALQCSTLGHHTRRVLLSVHIL